MLKHWLISRILRPFRIAGAIAAAMACLVLLLGLLKAPGVWQAASLMWKHLAAHVTTVSAPSPVIIERLQALNRLETARQVTRHVVEAKSESLPLPAFLTGDKLLMLAQAEVVAGVDLSGLSAKDVAVSGSAVVVQLPAPQFLSIAIDDTHSQVYNRQRGWLVFRPDPDLERQARLKARLDARQSALENGVLKTARTHAEENIRSLLLMLGFQKIDLRWSDLAGSVGMERL
ncbi:MAG: DUF4230 domain-containing protein [Armatimonadetes bacterium]|nr:DUF4230 domain-containing protein [Armatimonadota bacterium]